MNIRLKKLRVQKRYFPKDSLKIEQLISKKPFLKNIFVRVSKNYFFSILTFTLFKISQNGQMDVYQRFRAQLLIHISTCFLKLLITG